MAKKVNGRKIVQAKDLDIHIEAYLEEYSQQAIVATDMLCEEAVKRIAEASKATAPKGRRGKFRRSITSGETTKTRYRRVYAWYVRPPEHRLTHLLVKGHATRDGGRTRANSFLHNAVDEVMPWFEERLEQVLKNGGQR